MQEGERLKQIRIESTHLANTSQDKLKNKEAVSSLIQKKQQKPENDKLSGCNFCMTHEEGLN